MALAVVYAQQPHYEQTDASELFRAHMSTTWTVYGRLLLTFKFVLFTIRLVYNKEGTMLT